MRVELAERVLVTWLVLDASASMAFGTADRRKADVAEGVAIAVGYAATRRGNRLGHDRVRRAEPRSSRRARGAARCSTRCSCCATLPPGGQRHARATRSSSPTASRASARCVVVVSDFRGPLDWRAAAASPRRRGTPCSRSRSATRASRSSPTSASCALVDPETGRQLRVDTGDRGLRERFAAAAADERRALVALLASAGVRHVALSTEGDWLRPLAAFLRRGERVR